MRTAAHVYMASSITGAWCQIMGITITAAEPATTRHVAVLVADVRRYGENFTLGLVHWLNKRWPEHTVGLCNAVHSTHIKIPHTITVPRVHRQAHPRLSTIAAGGTIYTVVRDAVATTGGGGRHRRSMHAESKDDKRVNVPTGTRIETD
jgi:hypothetical protein